jgi:uncharacterized protein involved in cysteine biosynthesis
MAVGMSHCPGLLDRDQTMNFIKGIRYNLRGMKVALKNPKLLLLGFSRLVAVVALMMALAGLIVYHHTTILNLLWTLLIHNIPFHLGFGILFLIPFLNMVFLSFAPVGATLYYLDNQDEA